MDRKKIVNKVLLRLAEKDKTLDEYSLKEGFQILKKYEELNNDLQAHLLKIRKLKKK